MASPIDPIALDCTIPFAYFGGFIVTARLQEKKARLHATCTEEFHDHHDYTLQSNWDDNALMKCCR